MKGKVTHSLAAGLPVVTTSVGAEGIDGRDGEVMLIADDAAGVADRIAHGCGDDALWSELSRAGQALVERTCSPASMKERLAALIERSAARR